MDWKNKRNLAVTAGLTAALALSPVAGLVVTALADEAGTDAAQQGQVTRATDESSDLDLDLDLDMDRFALNKHVEIEFHEADGTHIDTLYRDIRFNLTNYVSYVPAKEVVDAFVTKHPEYKDVQWATTNKYDFGPLELEGAGFGGGLADYVDDEGWGYCHVDLYVYEPKPDTVTVTFDDAVEETDDQVITVETGSTVNPSDVTTPSREGYDFVGWYTDEACTTQYDFDAPVTSDLTLYAKWTEAEQPTDPENPGTGTEKPGDETQDQGGDETQGQGSDTTDTTDTKAGDPRRRPTTPPTLTRTPCPRPPTRPSRSPASPASAPSSPASARS